MSGDSSGRDGAVVSWQTGRAPRAPWRVAARCAHGYPTVIVSPERLEDGEPFPTWAWLTCPHLAEQVGLRESAGDIARWSERVRTDRSLAAALLSADERMRRAREGEGERAAECAGTGIAGQRDPLQVKCLHARVALVVAGVPDPVGTEVLESLVAVCADARCDAAVLDETPGSRT